MAAGGAVPDPVHEVIEGRTWHVLPTLLTATAFLEERGPRVKRRLRSQGLQCSVGSVHAVPGQAVTATIVIDADTPGAAGDVGTRLLREASNAEGIDTPVVRELRVLPAWRDRRDWSLDDRTPSLGSHQGESAWPLPAESVPNPAHEVVEGRTWKVQPTLLTTTEYSKERNRGLDNRLRSRGIRCRAGWADGETGEGVTANIFVDADTPGAAGDIGIRLLLEVSAAEEIDTPVLQRVDVVPAWRDEEDFLVH